MKVIAVLPLLAALLVPSGAGAVDLLIKEIKRSPFQGIGKPEPLKHALKGYWSRRINDEHRIVYAVSEDLVMVAQLRNNY